MDEKGVGVWAKTLFRAKRMHRSKLTLKTEDFGL
jgi:hypothetical protein